ncbi:hypothetical protein KAH94_03180 [bacterium]|nr:hypothetical protein [bacterium]
MPNEEKNVPDRILERKYYKLLRYGDIRKIDGKDKLFFNYVIDRSTRTDKKDAQGNVIYDNNSFNLSKLEDTAYIESLLYRLKSKNTENEIQSQFYFAKKLKNEQGKYNKFLLTKEYTDSTTNTKKRTKDCVFPLITLPILLNFLKEINLKTGSIYQKERFHKNKFYNEGRSEEPIPEESGVVENLNDEIPF